MSALTNIEASSYVDAGVDEVEEEVRIGHHDPTALPDCMQADDAYSQDELHDVLYASSEGGADDYLMRYRKVPIKRTKLSTLRHLMETDDRKQAVSLLQRRRTIELDDEYLLDLDDSNVTPRVGPHYIDFTLYVGDQIGLSPVLPRRENDPTWSMRFSLNHTAELWPTADACHLPFHTAGRMLKIGTRLQENIWLAMVPTTYMERDHWDNVSGKYPRLGATTSALKPTHVLMVTTFFAFVLNEMRFCDIHYEVKYPEPLTREAVNQSTEILRRSGDHAIQTVS
ncbi:hypothetical protein JVU11DRAFT_12216 [Chiua virens]|nr:hypothetical protein JVU11DRAFT_12216 [Chiua virens]